MSRDFALSAEHDLLTELKARFPLLDRLVGQFGENTPEESVPWFLGLLMAAATRREPGACCFVLDKTRGTTAITAVLLALTHLQREFPKLAEDYARRAFQLGQRVRVKPGNHVYEYDGLFEVDDGFPARFRLKELGSKNVRSFWCADVLRLEPTEYKRPKGKLGDLPDFERGSIDRLLDLTTCGNNSIFRNSVLLYMTQARFEEVVNTITLTSEEASESERLSSFLPWGSVSPDGTLKPNDAYQVTGEPLVAVSRSPEGLASSAQSTNVAEKVVLVDGARGLAADLQAFDDMVEQQRVVILASPDETEALQLLADQDCPIWRMSPSEITIGETSSHRRTRASLVGATIRRAETRRRSKVATIDCRDDALETVADRLERSAAMIESDHETPEVEEMVARLYGILLECSESFFGVGEETVGRLENARELFSQNRMWLERPLAEEFQQAIDELENAMRDGFGRHKAYALLSLVTQPRGDWAVVARSPQDAKRINAGLRKLGADVPTFPIATLNSDQEYEGVIVPAWPNSRRFTRLENLGVTEDIRVLVYPFERKWVSHQQARNRASARSNQLEVEDRASILGIDSRFLPELKTDDAPKTAPRLREIPTDLPIFRITERIAKRRTQPPSTAAIGADARQARFIQFFGNCHALLTEWSTLRLLNELVEHREDARIRQKRASELSMGDFVLFRDAGNKDFIRLIAEEALGPSKYELDRELSGRWRISLHRLGGDAATIQWNLRQRGLDRSVHAIRGWLNNPDLIGPQRDDDIEIIARASGDAELLRIQSDVTEAIGTIRTAHRRAGHHLTTLILRELVDRIDSVGEEPTPLDLEYGKAWVVQVASVDPKPSDYPANQVNRLHRADEKGFWDE